MQLEVTNTVEPLLRERVMITQNVTDPKQWKGM